MRPGVGDALYSNNRRAMLTILEDTSPGVHDTLLAACDNYRYGLLGCTEYHDNCTDNLHAALTELGATAPKTPSPLNLFMNIPWTESGGLSFEAPVTKPGDYILMRAEMDLIVAFSRLSPGYPADQRRDVRSGRGPFRDSLTGWHMNRSAVKSVT